ncbi:MAG TPA: ATP-binding protein [bacterium]
MNQLKILMVEDNPDHAFLAKSCLEKVKGHTVTTVGTYDECCKALNQYSYDMILLDYNLPGDDGLTILKRLKKDVKTDAAIVVVTGHGHEEVAVEAMKNGACDYVIKTNDYPAILPEVVKSAFEKHTAFREKQRMEQEIILRNMELHALNTISTVVNQTLDVDTVIDSAVQRITQVLDLEYGAIYLIDESTQAPVLRADTVLSSDSKELVAPYFKECLQQLLDEPQPWLLKTCAIGNLQSLLAILLIHNARKLGVVFLGSDSGDYFDERRINLVSSICNQIGIAIVNANLYLELNKAKNDFENVLNSSLDLIITLTREGEIRFHNDQFAKRYYSGVNNADRDFLSFIPETKRPFFLSKLEELAAGKSATYESELVNRDGSTMPCIISQSPLRGKDEYLMVIKDTSNIVNLHKRLIQAEKLSALGQMIAGVAHELNNPLAGILGYAQLLLEEKLPTNVSNDIRVILKEGKRCQRIVKNLLTFARKHNSERELIDINQLLNSILELSAYDLKVGTVSLLKDLDPQLPKVYGDYNQLQQVFLNLISNALFALKTVKKEHKEIKVRSERMADGIRIQVMDNGPGIAPEQKSKIFDPFYTTKEVGQGIGLGLSICFGIVHSHHGSLYLEGECQNGATFVVELPVAEEKVGPIEVVESVLQS